MIFRDLLDKGAMDVSTRKATLKLYSEANLLKKKEKEKEKKVSYTARYSQNNNYTEAS